MSNKKESFFWTSYSDLMTSLFFVMLVLFILTIALMHNKHKATAEQLKKVTELNNSIKQIDTSYFVYDSTFKRHTLKDITIEFEKQSNNINDINRQNRLRLLEAGRAIQTFMKKAQDSIPGADYLLIVEGQSSKDGYVGNNVLSYERALSLVKYWKANGLSFEGLPCEIIISGSGQDSKFREPERINGKINTRNQRFVIHIIPKPGNF